MTIDDIFAGPSDYYPGPAVAALMKLSFDEEHRHAVCTLGKCKVLYILYFVVSVFNVSSESSLMIVSIFRKLHLYFWFRDA